MINEKLITLGITGASGAAYGLKLLEQLLKAKCEVYFMISKAGQMVLATETEFSLPAKTKDMQNYLGEKFAASDNQIHVFGQEQWNAPIASGSNRSRAMVVCPCTSGTLSSVASGSSNNLMERAADVMIKEARQLILVLRETPLSAIHLENALKLARCGVTIMPATPGFYYGEQNLQQIIDFMVAKILDQLNIPHELTPRWGES